MDQPHVELRSATGPASLWTGRVLAGAVTFVFGMSGFMKLKGGEELAEGMSQFGFPDSIIIPLAVLELTCLAIYLIPRTSILGAILLTGYLGGAICTHWRVGDAFFVQVGIGVLIWLSLYLREPRLRLLIPLRSARDSG
ncbi:MAG: DoxX family protein [Planctomycetota bacterium]|nr:DoxX family protein [Planctomycetota bacterium]